MQYMNPFDSNPGLFQKPDAIGSFTLSFCTSVLTMVYAEFPL